MLLTSTRNLAESGNIHFLGHWHSDSRPWYPVFDAKIANAGAGDAVLALYFSIKCSPHFKILIPLSHDVLQSVIFPPSSAIEDSDSRRRYPVFDAKTTNAGAGDEVLAL